MALYIIADNREYNWHVGEPNPVRFEHVDDVIEVQADGDELEHIEMMFRSNSFPLFFNKRVCRWFGDYAKLIVGNLD